MCVDYRDLNRASLKDNFPLPYVDVLVDSTANFALFSFMDRFSGYNQIKMALKDMEKTTFVTLWGMFCYQMMSFGLKNAGATYQRAMVALFHDMIHKEVEVYVDDMIAKSKTEEEHLVNLQKLFERLRKYRLRLNPTKCTFGVYRNLPFGGRAMRGSWVHLPRKENVRSCHQRLFKENIGKPKAGLRTLRIKGLGVVFTYGEGISTPRVRHKGRQPLIKCEKS